MAEPQDAAITLQDASEIVQQDYMETYFEHYPARFKNVTNKCFKPEPMAVSGDGINMQYELGPADSVRFQTNPLGNIANPQNISPGTIKVRWNQSNTALHDFSQVTARCQFDIYTIENRSAGTIVNLAQRIYKDVQGDFDGKMAVLRNSPKSGQLALVNGGPVGADRETYADATTSASNANGMCVKIDSGPISAFLPNTRVDFIRPSTGAVIAGNVIITDIPNYVEKSFRVAFVTSGITGELSTGNLANVNDNDIIVYSGMYGQGIWSFGAYFSAPAEGESFICGVDRTDTGYGWMIPQRINAASGALTKTLFNTAAQAMGYLSEDPMSAVVFKTDPTQHDRLRAELGEESFFQLPISDSRAERFMNFGSIGLNYQHPTFGTVKIMADALSSPTRVDILTNGTWKALSYAWQGLRILPGDGGGHWYRMSQSAPNTGKGLIMAADWAGNVCDFGTMPWKNGCIHTLATA